MIPTFHFKTSGISDDPKDLLLEIGNGSISYIVIDDKMECTELTSYHLQKDINPEKLCECLKEIIYRHSLHSLIFRKINIIYSFPVTEMIPEEFMNRAASIGILEMVYGSIPSTDIKVDVVHTQNMNVIYSVPADVEMLISETFRNTNESHLYSVLAGLATDNTSPQLKCIFSTTGFVAALYLSGKIQIIRHFCYDTPEDVSYHLLNICRNSAIDTNHISLQLFGMIDTASNLYKELHKYFLHIDLATLNDTKRYPEEMKEYPTHYFAHLFLMASCV